jgi:hypothetical protein
MFNSLVIIIDHEKRLSVEISVGGYMVWKIVAPKVDPRTL